MNSTEISKIIEKELNGNLKLSNLHGVDLQKCLVKPPARQVFSDSFNEGKALYFWLVLEEISEDKSGYKIIFDEKALMFGLATANNVFIGFHGTFIKTLKSM